MSTQTIDKSNPFFFYDMDKICAICLKKLEKDKTLPISKRIPNSIPEINAFEVLQTVSKFNIDNGPTSICITCYNNIKAAYKFQQMCNQAHEYIQNYLEHQSLMKACAPEPTNCVPHVENIEVVSQNAPQTTSPIRKEVRHKKCKVCYKMVRAENLNTHMRVHTGEKPYQCEECKRSFSQSNSLKTHMRYHRGEREFMCNHCGKAFIVLGDLTTHLKTHSEERPFKCSMCEMTFKSPKNCRRHERVHSQEKRFQCEVCAKSFTRMCNLRVHTKIHTNERNHVCTFCGKAFIQAHSLQSHLRTHQRYDAADCYVEDISTTITVAPDIEPASDSFPSF